MRLNRGKCVVDQAIAKATDAELEKAERWANRKGLSGLRGRILEEMARRSSASAGAGDSDLGFDPDDEDPKVLALVASYILDEGHSFVGRFEMLGDCILERHGGDVDTLLRIARDLVEVAIEKRQTMVGRGAAPDGELPEDRGGNVYE